MVKALTRLLTCVALVPVALIAFWAVGWRHWTAVIGAVFVAAFIGFTTHAGARTVRGN